MSKDLPVYKLNEVDNENKSFFAVFNISERRKANQNRIDRLARPHRHNFYSFSLVTKFKGQADYSIDFKNYQVKENSLFFIVPNQVHLMDSNSRNVEIDGFVIFFTIDFLVNNNSFLHDNLNILNQSLSDNALFLDKKETDTLKDIIIKMQTEFKSDSYLKNNALFHLLNIFLIEC